ncbi:unnamed protein product [Orchesella dallaii]|uniref:Odorant receptor n=1 Tax=Orchesella dallaii TaxID=48710 RepID=A0ABP1QM42_9HEXA
MKPSNNFCYWNWILQHLYLFNYMVVLIVNLIIKFRGEPDNDIPDEVVRIKDEAFDAMLTAIDIAYISLIAVTLGLSINLILVRQELITLFNKIVEVDTKLTEKYEMELEGNPTVNKYVMRAELTFAATNFIAVFMAPGMFLVVFLQDFEPLHRFLAEVFEIHVTFTFEHMPILLWMVFSASNCLNVLYIHAFITNWNIHVICFWLVNTTPKKDSLIQYTNRNRGIHCAPLFSTKLGLMEGSVIMNIYKQLQYLDRLVDNLLTSFLITIHHGGGMIVFVASCYICIQYVDDLVATPVLMMLICAPLLITFVEFVETVELSRINDASRSSLGILKDRFRTSFATSKNRKSKELWKMAQAAPVLWMETAYPFYRFHRGTLLEYFDQTIDLLVSVLVG